MMKGQNNCVRTSMIPKAEASFEHILLYSFSHFTISQQTFNITITIVISSQGRATYFKLYLNRDPSGIFKASTFKGLKLSFLSYYNIYLNLR